jgi:hypothetical protein
MGVTEEAQIKISNRLGSSAKSKNAGAMTSIDFEGGLFKH